MRKIQVNIPMNEAVAAPPRHGEKGVIDFIFTPLTIPSHLSKQLIPAPSESRSQGICRPQTPQWENNPAKRCEIDSASIIFFS